MSIKGMRLNSKDIDFLIETVAPDVSDKERLKYIISEDEDFRDEFIGDEKVFKRIMEDDEIFVRISPTLFFEVLLKKAAKDISRSSYTIEKMTHMSIPVFDSQEVVDLLNKKPLLHYLADMLSSFTKIRSYSFSLRFKKGGLREITFSDTDLPTLIALCDVVEERYRLGLYKRIADICLFMLGVFPEFVEREYRYPSGELRPQIPGRVRFSPDEYEREGRKFYRLAAEHETAKELNMDEVFWELHGHFKEAQKPLNFISSRYINYRKDQLF
jgi:hypothetical protein